MPPEVPATVKVTAPVEPLFVMTPVPVRLLTPGQVWNTRSLDAKLELADVKHWLLPVGTMALMLVELTYSTAWKFAGDPELDTLPPPGGFWNVGATPAPLDVSTNPDVPAAVLAVVWFPVAYSTPSSVKFVELVSTWLATMLESAGVFDAPNDTRSPLAPEKAVPLILSTVTTLLPDVVASPESSEAV